jgi:N-terminal domain of anti-restriction factor ArdC
MSRFHKYSWGNLLLIAFQRPSALHVAGFHTWKSLGRFVKKGEKGIMILAPIVVKRSPDKDATVEEPNGTEKALVGFRPVYVWERLSRDLRLSLCALDGCRESHFRKPSIAASTSSLNSSGLSNAP